MRIAICNTIREAYSETFVKAQVDFLPAALVLHDGMPPTMVDGKLIKAENKKIAELTGGTKVAQESLSLEDEIVCLLKREKIDIVLAQFGPVGYSIREVCRKAQIPFVVHFHGYDASGNKLLADYEEKYKLLFSDAKGVIAVSKIMAKKLREIGCPAEKITLIYYGPNAKFFDLKPKYDSVTFFGIGRFVDKKAPYLTLLAFAEVLKKVPEAKLILGGDGILLNTCKNIAKAFGIENSVSFPGILKPEETMQLMEKSLAYVQHSVIADTGDSEGTPVAVLEAAAAALPVIATYHGGIPDVIINNETGFLLEEYDIAGMAQAMLTLIDNKENAKKLGMAGRERIKNNFTMDKYISDIRNLLNTTVENEKGLLISQLQQIVEEKEVKASALEANVLELKKIIEEKENNALELKKIIEEKENTIKQKENNVIELKKIVAEKENTVKSLENTIEQKENNVIELKR
ncbi:MAG: glycosyltransferase [Bacteroidetes bacterium]|nr:glycosyltransferase [Bacteroidota bacterium]